MDEENNNSPHQRSDKDLHEKIKEFETLKKEITSQIRDIEKNGDEKTKERINKLKNTFEDKRESFPEVNEENIDKNIAGLKKLNRGVGFYKKFMNAFETEIDIDPGRLMGLTDGIFGMVMTLLVFSMALPEAEIANSLGFSQFISSIAPTIGITIVSFVFISSFWIYHHEFIKIKNINILYLWINIFFLASISFIPFTTSMIGTYSEFFLAEVIFGLNIFITLIFFLLMFYYANKRKFLEKEVSDEERKYIYQTFFIIMILTMIVNLLDYNVSPKCIYLFLLIPVISTLRDIEFKLKHQNEQ